MKKTVAAIGASVLGLSGALVSMSAPATAATPKCADASEHVVSPTADGSQDWYMDCIPQYGLGKAEFTITTTDPDGFPGGYDLADGNQTVTSNVDTAAAAAYFGMPSTGAAGAFLEMGSANPATATSQTYGGGGSNSNQHAIFPIASVGKLTTALPAGCFPNTETPETYEGAYVVKFKPTTTTFTETIGGKKVTATVTSAAAPLELGLNFAGGALDESAPLCAASAGVVYQGDSLEDGDWIAIAQGEATLNPGNTQTFDPSVNGSEYDLGTFAATVGDPAVTTPPTTTTTTTTSEPSLAFTGVDPVPAGVLGGSLLAAGLAFFVYGRVRRRAAKRS
jgi:hypothetical protein